MSHSSYPKSNPNPNARLQAGIDAPVGGAPVVVEAPVVVRESPAARLARLALPLASKLTLILIPI